MTFDFLEHCKGCDKVNIHCCTKKNNIVLVNDSERSHILSLFNKKVAEGTIEVSTGFQLFDESKRKKDLVPLNFLIQTVKHNSKDIERKTCPFFKNEKCTIHNDGKPLDCQLWPIAQYENSTNDKIYFDKNCNAIHGRKPIPLEEIDKDIALLNQIDDKTIKNYFEENNEHYNISSMKRPLWVWYQDFKAETFEKLDIITGKIGREKKAFNDYTSGVDTTKILSGSKWILGIAFILAIESLVDQSVHNVSVPLHLNFLNQLSSSMGDILFNSPPVIYHFTLSAILFGCFIIDFYRMLVPLPWVVKHFDKNNKSQGHKFPKVELQKLVIIGLPTFLILNIIAVRYIVHPQFYMLLFSIILFIDLFWYEKIRFSDRFLLTRKFKPLKNPLSNLFRFKSFDDKFKKLQQETQNEFVRLKKETSTELNEKVNSIKIEDGKTDFSQILEDELESTQKLYEAQSQKLLIDIEGLAKKNDDVVGFIRKFKIEVEKEQQFIQHTLIDLLLCFIGTLTIFILSRYEIIPYANVAVGWNFLYSYEMLLLYVFVLHMVWGVRELKANNLYKDYIEYYLNPNQ